MKNDITTIICVWRRDSLEEILERVTAQTIASDIIVWQNENCVNIDDLHNKYNFTHIHSKNHNWKFHSRFCIPLVVDTPYITILDDDVLPNPKWFEKALNFVEEKDCILGSSGRIIQPQNNYSQSIDMGENGDKQVDFVGHTWFFKRECIYDMWRCPVPTFESGEDIHFCAANEVYSGRKTYVASCLIDEENPNHDRFKYGADKHQSSSFDPKSHISHRRTMIDFWVKKGWKLLL